MRAEQITGVVSEHGEGPVWIDGALRFVDLLAGDLLELLPTGSVRRSHVDRVLAAFRPRAQGGLVVGVEHGFRLLDRDGAADGPTVTAFDDPRIRMNDGGCDPQGRFYCGTMAYAKTPGAGTLYRFDPDGSVTTVLRGVTISNGLQWSGDGASAFYNDTPTAQITRFDFDGEAGTLSGRRPFVVLPKGSAPDGMAIDAEDGVWIALWGGGAIHRYAPDGTLSAVVEVPVPNPTDCAFGGEGGTTLYITSSRQGGGDASASSGAVFAAEVGITSGIVHTFAG